MLRKIPFTKKVIGLLVVIILFAGTSAVMVYGNLRSIINEITEEARPDEKLIVMKEMLYDISDAENCAKSYSLTHNPAYLDQFDNCTQQVDDKIQQLRKLSKEDQTFLNNVDSLDQLTKNKFVVLEDLLILQDQFKVDALFEEVIQNIEQAGKKKDQPENEEEQIQENENEKLGFFERLKKRRKEKKEEKEEEEIEGSESMVDESLSQLEQEVTQIKSKSMDDQKQLKAEELRLIQEDQNIMKRITSIFDRLENQESEAMAAQLEEAEDQSETTKYVLAGFSILMTFLLIVAASTIYTYVKRNETYKRALKSAKDETEQKNKEVMDSIHYAKRIQAAILPDTKKVAHCVPDSFILYKPKDIVAGDFYWMVRLDQNVLIASADCTGHGVPGAMVSVVCSNALNRSVREFGLTEPAKILEKTRELVIETLDEGDLKVTDGMDIALCNIDMKSHMVQYAGANNSLYTIRNNNLQEIKADKQPVGRYSNARPFTNHTIQLAKGDKVYLFTDGFADQFGGPKGKKYKYKPFKKLLLDTSQLTPVQQQTQMDQAFEGWRGTHEQVDDVCVIGVRI